MQDKGVYSVGSVGVESVLSTNKVLKNTYMLLGITLVFSAVTAALSMAMGLGQGMALILMLVGFGLLFVVHKMADSSKGLLAIFAFAGVMGASIGPMLNHYLDGRSARRRRCDDCQHLSRCPGPVAHNFGGDRDDHVWPYPVRHEPYHQWWRNQLYPCDGIVVSRHL